MKKILPLILCMSSLLIVSCAIHRVDVQQGNVINSELVSQIKIGMDKKQVKFVLGTPLIADPFHPDRWDYVYMFKPGNQEREQYHVTLYFQDDQLVKIDNKTSAQE